jgi:TolB-like protein
MPSRSILSTASQRIVDALAQVPGLRVAGRSSASSIKDRNEDLRQVGDRLGVSTILEAMPRRAGNRLRVTGQCL